MSQESLLTTNSEREGLVEAQIAELQKITDYEIREWPIEVLVEKFTSGRDTDSSEIFIPDYQREMVWSAKQQSRFIESILIRLPVPFIFAADVGAGDREGALEIVDGSQRLRTLDNFLSNRLRLQDLVRLTAANGMYLSDFSKPRQLRFKRSTVRVIELSEQADEQARREMFDRLNSGGSKLTSMEIRRGVEDGPFMRMVTECAGNKLFKEMVPLSERNAKRKEYEELALRYFAYANNYKAFQKSVDEFLTSYLKDRNEHVTEDQTQSMIAEFVRSLQFVQNHFPNGFKRESYRTVPRIRFEAIAVGVTLALRLEPDLQPENIGAWLDSPDFIKHTRSDASNSRPKLINRIHYVRDNLLGKEVEEDPDTSLVEQSANEDAPPDNEPQQAGLFE
ncbi:GmrSD restriction endonuclease domain-containing protein [Achromobacter aegrifaciens]